MSTILMGYRGCGKTTIGRKLADRLWQKFVDVDEGIVARAGKSIAEVFAHEGETYFRNIESEVVRQVSELDDHVIAMGGGSLIREENRKVLKERPHRFIYLRCEPEELLKRVSQDANSAATRPNLTPLGGGIEEIRQLVAQREPIYRQMADAELDVTNLSVDDAVVYIVRLL